MTKMMFKRSAMALAVAGALGVAAPAVQAVNLAADGLGEVLLFPYYTTRNGYDTYLNVTNTSDKTVTYKIRFREAHNSRDCRDFNVVLSPKDVWTAAVTEAINPATGNEEPRIQTGDNSCTQPILKADAGNSVPGIFMSTAGFTGVLADGGPITIDRCREGYVEVIEMGVAKSETLSIPVNSKHGSNGVPADCGAVERAYADPVAVAAQFNEPNNVLKGSAALIKVDQGKAAGYDPTVLANFYNPSEFGDDDASPQNIVFSPVNEDPRLTLALPASSVVKVDSGPGAGAFAVAVEDWNTGIEAVSAVLTRGSVINQYSVAPGVKAETDWVLTFPTKWRYVDTLYKGSGPALPPFAHNFQKDTDGDGFACDDILIQIYDREEKTTQTETPICPSPDDGSCTAKKAQLCKEVNILTFNDKNPLGSSVAQSIDVAALGFESGWADLSFVGESAAVQGEFPGGTYGGLPVIGFAFTTLENGVASDNLLNYGMVFNHSYRRQVSGF